MNSSKLLFLSETHQGMCYDTGQKGSSFVAQGAEADALYVAAAAQDAPLAAARAETLHGDAQGECRPGIRGRLGGRKEWPNLRQPRDRKPGQSFIGAQAVGEEEGIDQGLFRQIRDRAWAARIRAACRESLRPKSRSLQGAGRHAGLSGPHAVSEIRPRALPALFCHLGPGVAQGDGPVEDGAVGTVIEAVRAEESLAFELEAVLGRGLGQGGFSTLQSVSTSREDGLIWVRKSASLPGNSTVKRRS